MGRIGDEAGNAPPPVFTESSYTEEPHGFKRLTRQHFKNNWNALTGKQSKRPHGIARQRRRHMLGKQDRPRRRGRDG